MMRHEWLAPLPFAWEEAGGTFGGAPARFGVAHCDRPQFVHWLREFWAGGNAGETVIDATVRRGYDSPYRFAARLRELVGDPDAEVFSYPFPDGQVHWSRSDDRLAVYYVEHHPPADFGPRLKSLRESVGLTVQTLATATGLSRAGLYKLESGESKPTWDVVQRLAKALGVPTDHFRE